jgi:LPXTG-motif cell wall-anchored protein
MPTDADVGATVTVTVTNDPAGTCANSYTVLADTTVEATTTTTAPETTVDNTGEDPEEDPAVDDTEMTAECTQQGTVVYRGGVPLSGTSLQVGGGSTRGRFALQVDPANGEVTCEFDVTGIPEGGTERVPINESELTVDVEEASAARSNLPATGASHGGLFALGGAAVGLGLVLTVTGRRRRATA